jgi:hypothetical protein
MGDAKLTEMINSSENEFQNWWLRHEVKGRIEGVKE